MLCRSELRGLGDIQDELEALGVRLLTLSVDAEDDARRLAKRERLDFPVLCDTKREVIDAYGLRH